MPEIFGCIPWGHHIDIVSRSTTLDEALFYAKQVAKFGWSRPQLNAKIDSQLFQAQGAICSNFESTLPAEQSQVTSQAVAYLVDESDRGQDIYMDSGYTGQAETVKACGANPIICEKGFRNHPLTDEQKANNRAKSKVRCRIEHIFGFQEGAMKGLVVRSIGLLRAKANVARTNLVYNICRYIQILRYYLSWVK